LVAEGARQAWRRMLPHALLVAPALLFFAPALFFGRALYLRDTGLYFYPHKALIARALHEGRLPQWNPFEYGGMPLLVDPNFNVFHPLSLLTWALPLPLGFTLFVLGCALVAAYGARALAKSLGSSEGGALLAGLAFAWSGPFVSLIESGQCAAPAFLPWMCAAGAWIGQAKTGERTKPAALAAIAAALIFLSGTPEIGACALGLALVCAAACSERGRRVSALAAASFALVLGAGLSAVQLLPTAAFLRFSSRQDGFAYQHASAYSLHPLRLPGIAVPYFAGELDAPGTPQWLLDSGTHTPYVQEIYAGSLILLLAMLALRRPERRRLWLAGGCFAFLPLAFGSHTPVFGLARAVLPFLRVVRYPEKFIVLPALAIAMLAGAGWDLLRDWSAREPAVEASPRLGRALLAAALGLLGAATLALVLATRPGAFDAQLGPARAACLRATALPGIGAEALLVALALLLVLLRSRRGIGPGPFLLGASALVVLELAPPAARMDYTVPATEVTAASPLAAVLRGQPAANLELDRISVKATGLDAVQLDTLFDPSWPRPRKLFALRRAALWDAGAALAGIHSDRGYSGFTPGPLQKVYVSGEGRAVLDLLGVRYGIEFGHGAPVYAPLGFTPALRASDGELRVYRNPSPREKARLVSAVLAGPEAAGIAPRCSGREAVWVSAADAAKLPAGLRAAASCMQLAPEGASGEARLLRYEPEHVLVETVAMAPALLLLADTWDPGWSARIDGAPADSLAADGALRAVAVPAGRHRVEWTYSTPGLRQGALLSALSLCVLTGILCVGRRRRTG
jgi:hypothetical protein